MKNKKINTKEKSTVKILNQKILNELVTEILMLQNSDLINNNFPSLSKLKPFIIPNTEAKKTSSLPQTKAFLRCKISHAIHLYESNSIYTFIPKNACSTMRYSVAFANGFIQGKEEVDWIHNNNVTLSVKNLSPLLNPNYSFVILRCPYSRLVSVFFDKFIKKTGGARKFGQKHQPNLALDDLSFHEFVNTISALNPHTYNEHWRPQTHFLLYNEYSRYFALEDFATAVQTLEQDIGFKVYDTRDKIKHHTGHIRTSETIPEPWNLTLKELKALPSLPKVETMFSPEMIKTVQSIYADDIELYCSKFGPDNLTFK
jgi:hypothetical protein